MGSVVPLKKSANSAYLELKDLLSGKLLSVEALIQEKLKKCFQLVKDLEKDLGKDLKEIF